MMMVAASVGGRGVDSCILRGQDADLTPPRHPGPPRVCATNAGIRTCRELYHGMSLPVLQFKSYADDAVGGESYHEWTVDLARNIIFILARIERRQCESESRMRAVNRSSDEPKLRDSECNPQGNVTGFNNARVYSRMEVDQATVPKLRTLRRNSQDNVDLWFFWRFINHTFASQVWLNRSASRQLHDSEVHEGN